MHATMTSKGQLTIPKPVRERLGLRAGDRVEFVQAEDGAYRIVPRSGKFSDLMGVLKTDIALSDGHLRDAIRDARTARWSRNADHEGT